MTTGTGRIEVDKWLGREFHWRNYNCWDFAREVWLEYSGVDAGKRTPADLTKLNLVQAFNDQATQVDGPIFTRLKDREDPCLVIMLRPKVLSHVGVFVRGKLLHLPTRGMSIHQDLADAAMGFTEIRYYK